MLKAALALLTLAMPASDADVRPVKMGPGDIPIGTYCRVQDVCVIAQTDADCGKIDGQVLETLEACTGATAAAAPEPSK